MGIAPASNGVRHGVSSRLEVRILFPPFGTPKLPLETLRTDPRRYRPGSASPKHAIRPI